MQTGTYPASPLRRGGKRFDLRAEFATAWPLGGRMQSDLRNLCKIDRNVLYYYNSNKITLLEYNVQDVLAGRSLDALP